ncbi:MAG: TolC family protein [Lacipirellulaceae bacterium]
MAPRRFVLIAALCVLGGALGLPRGVVGAEELASELPKSLPKVVGESADEGALRVVEAPPTESVWTIDGVESLALAASAAVRAAEALVRASECAAYQAGQKPNPTFGYSTAEIGQEGEAGQQGVGFGQDVVRGGKLRLDQTVLLREAQRRREELAATTQRVRTDARTAFWVALLAQREARLAESLVSTAHRAETTAQALFDSGEGRRNDLLLAEIEAQRAEADLAQAQAQATGAWRVLANLMGAPSLAEAPMAGDVDSLVWGEPWESTAARLLSTSPEVSAAVAEVDRARAQLARERAEPIPNLNLQGTVQYDYATEYTVVGIQALAPIPVRNRNRGGISRAAHELAAARERVTQVEQRLRGELAGQVQAYEASRAQADALKGKILDRAEENLRLVSDGYEAGEVGFLDVLTAQRTYFRVNLEYLAALRGVSKSLALIEGRMLSGSLGSP